MSNPIENRKEKFEKNDWFRTAGKQNKQNKQNKLNKNEKIGEIIRKGLKELETKIINKIKELEEMGI